VETIVLDPANVDDRTAAAWHDLHRLLELEEAPDDEPVGLEQMVLRARNPHPEDDLTVILVVDDGGTAMAWAEVEMKDTEDNRHLAFVEGGVRPAVRRQGLGTQLLRAAAEVARRAGRTKLHLYAVEGSAGDRFLEGSGAKYVFLARRSRCLVAQIDRAEMERWAAARPGYTILTWDAPTPEQHLEDYAGVLHVMNTAPLQDLDYEDEVITADLVRGHEQTIVSRKATKWVSVARHDASGQLVGLSELFFDGFRHDRVGQWNTGVDPAHRGHGLGRALKATNALRLLDERPAARFIETENQDENGPMLAINDAMGFRPHLRCREYQIPVAEVLDPLPN
jgi:GNAT superfamily N-acetyltransferase